IRRQLAAIGLDWDAPAFSEDDPADPSAPALPPLQVDLGSFVNEHIELFTETPETLIERYTARLKQDPNDVEADHHRGHARWKLDRATEAIADFTQALRLRPGDPHFHSLRGRIYARSLQQLDPAIADLEAALAHQSDAVDLPNVLSTFCNNRAWELA